MLKKQNHILSHNDVLSRVLADRSGRFIDSEIYGSGKSYGYIANLRNSQIETEFREDRTVILHGGRLSDNERFDFDNRMIKKYIPELAERIDEIEREEGSALRMPVATCEIHKGNPVVLYFDRLAPGRDGAGNPCEYMVMYADKLGELHHMWIADGREALNKLTERVECALYSRLADYEKKRPAVTGRSSESAGADPKNNSNIVSPLEAFVNGGRV